MVCFISLVQPGPMMHQCPPERMALRRVLRHVSLHSVKSQSQKERGRRGRVEGGRHSEEAEATLVGMVVEVKEGKVIGGQERTKSPAADESSNQLSPLTSSGLVNLDTELLPVGVRSLELAQAGTATYLCDLTDEELAVVTSRLLRLGRRGGLGLNFGLDFDLGLDLNFGLALGLVVRLDNHLGSGGAGHIGGVWRERVG